jgi:hypothetical protein
MYEINNEINVYSEEVKDVLSHPPRALFKWGNTFLAGFIILLIFLSWLIKYPDIITAQATITTNNPPQKEFARVSGKLDSIFVQNNEIVTDGDYLAIIENNANIKDVVFIKSIVDSLLIASDTFQIPIITGDELILGDIAVAYSEFLINYERFDIHRKSESFTYNDITSSLTISEFKSRLLTLKNQRELSSQEVIYKKKELQRFRILQSKGVIAVQELERMELQYLQAVRDSENISISISQIQESLNISNNNKTQSNISYSNERIDLFNNLKISLNQLKSAIKDWEYKYVFKSNISGKVSYMKLWNSNQTLAIDDFVFTIVPTENLKFICKSLVPIKNSGKVIKGHKVIIKLSNYPSSQYGVLTGVVQNISLIPNNEGFYLVDISLEKDLLTSYNSRIAFRQEMAGEALIITEDLRLLERTLYQFRQAINR